VAGWTPDLVSLIQFGFSQFGFSRHQSASSAASHIRALLVGAGLGGRVLLRTSLVFAAGEEEPESGRERLNHDDDGFGRWRAGGLPDEPLVSGWCVLR
jgi:hypothetical protein